MLNYQKIILESENFASEHTQINSFGNGDLWEVVERDKLQSFNYPMLWMQDNGSSIQDKAVFFNFNVLAIDQVLNGEENENFVKSSMHQVLLDYIAYFDRSVLYDIDGSKIKFDIQRNASLTSFTERFNDELTGWVMTVSIKTPFNYDKCNIPGIGSGVLPTPCSVYVNVENTESTILISQTVTSDNNTIEVPNISFTDSDGTVTSEPSGVDLVCTQQDNTKRAELPFIGTAPQCNVIFSAGGVTTFTTVESSTNIGTLTISTDDVTFSAFSLPWTPTAATPYYFKRTGTGDGSLIITD